jgi:hypothetical protein
MADQTKIDILIETANSAKNVRELRKSLMELKSAQEDVDKSSPEFSKLISGINETESRIGDLNDAFKTFAGTGMERLTSSTYLLKDGLQNLDLDKLKIAFGGISQLPKALAGELNKLSAVVNKLDFASLGDGMKKLSKSGVGELTKSIVQLGKAILTNPILLLAAVIVGLIAVVVKFYDKIIPLRIAIEAVGKAVDVVVQSLKDFADWIGITDFAGEEKATNTLANAQKEQAAVEKRYDREIALAQAAGKSTVDLEKQKEIAVRKSIQTQIDALNKLKQITGKLTDDQVKQLDDLKIAYADSINQTAVIEAKAAKDTADKEAKALEDRKKKNDEFQKARVEATKRANDTIYELDQKLQMNEETVQKAGAQKAFNDKKAQADKDLKAGTITKEKYNEEIKKLEKVLNKDLATIDKEYRIKTLKAESDALDAFIATTQKSREYASKSAGEGTFITADKLEKMLTENEGVYSAKLSEYNQIAMDAQKELDDFKLQSTGSADDKEKEARLKSAADIAKSQAATFEIDYLQKKDELLKTYRQKDLDIEIAGLEEKAAVQAGFDEKEKADLDKKYEGIKALDKQLVDTKIAILEKQKAKELDNADLTDAEKKNISEKYAQDEYNLKAGLIDDLTKKEKEAQTAKIALWAEYTDMVAGAVAAVSSISINSLQHEGQVFNQTKQNEMEDMAYSTAVKIQNIEDEAAFGTITAAEAAKKKKDLQDQEAKNEYETKLALYNFNKELKHKEFKRNKAFQLASAVMDTASGVMKSLASAPLAIGIVPNPVGIASLAAVISAGVANIAKILSTQEDAPGAPPKPPVLSAVPGDFNSSGSGAGSSSGSNFMAPQFFRLGQGQGTTNKPQRVYVLESDITDAQKRVDKVNVRNTHELGP